MFALNVKESLKKNWLHRITVRVILLLVQYFSLKQFRGNCVEQLEAANQKDVVNKPKATKQVYI